MPMSSSASYGFCVEDQLRNAVREDRRIKIPNLGIRSCRVHCAAEDSRQKPADSRDSYLRHHA
jgi:hypothetical protein